jgi:DNA-binding CsgD family transcriptional regulator/phage anti-repressor protein
VITPVAVSETDLRTMLRIVTAPDLGEDGYGLPWSTWHGLKDLVRCTDLAFNGIDVANSRHYLAQAGLDELGSSESGNVFWAHYRGSTCSYPERTGEFGFVTQTTDFLTLREHRQTPMYAEYLAAYDHDHEMLLCLPDGPGRQLRLIFFRGRTDPVFTDRDRALLILLRPHLHAAHLQLCRRRRGIPKLTDRQWEVLQLVDVGLGNTQIARRLHVTENTVRKHLENVFQRLDVSSRTAAVARAFPERVLAAHGSDRASE